MPGERPSLAETQEREALRLEQARLECEGIDLRATTEQLAHSRHREHLEAHAKRLRAHHAEIEAFQKRLEQFHDRYGPLGS